ncbi:hypothetical protein AAGT95_00090 [Salinicola lusitanus]|uniref:Uncharacterized protein n=1 Tax=Salinicola lusitanus TaxID=1949085 RepID=A0ABZ3CTC3_9GAMM
MTGFSCRRLCNGQRGGQAAVLIWPAVIGGSGSGAYNVSLTFGVGWCGLLSLAPKASSGIRDAGGILDVLDIARKSAPVSATRERWLRVEG